jgi:hypothetical protein
LRIGLLGVAALAAANAAAAEPLSIQRLFAAPEISAPILAPDGASYAVVHRPQHDGGKRYGHARGLRRRSERNREVRNVAQP